MIRKKFKIQGVERPGVALLVVLFIIMVITVLSLGYLSRSDVELACGENMILRTQMDYLAESGLEHARGLILNPQEVPSEYWTGALGQQIAAGNDYYDAQVVRDDSDPTERCNYIIDCNSYRLKNGEKIGQSNVRAQLRLDPCIALWTGANTTLWSGFTVYGDVFCNGNLTNQGTIDGDVFAGNVPTGSITGQKYAVADLLTMLTWPPVTVTDFTSKYGYGSLSGQTFGPYDPPQVCYSSGNLTLPGNVRIEGMLLVDGNLTVRSTNNKITAAKNLPALYVTGDLIIEKGANVEITGLAVVGRDIRIEDNTTISVPGGLFVYRSIIRVRTAADYSGNGNTAILYNTPTWRPSGGRTGGALEFDGVDDYVQSPNDVSKLQLTGDYTLLVWINPNATQNSWAGVFSKCDTSSSTNHWTLQFDSSTPKKLVVYHPDSLPSPKYWDTGIGLNNIAGAWHHVGIVRNGNTMTSYLDGVKRNTGTWANAPGSGDGHFNIGVDRTGYSTYVYKGLIDDVRVYNRVLDVNDVYPPRDGLAGLIGHWKLDEADPVVTVTAAPTRTAIICWSQDGTRQRWGQAAGAFFRSIQRR
jgi:cytoskeletal protein CcmA (bactofilin family)